MSGSDPLRVVLLDSVAREDAPYLVAAVGRAGQTLWSGAAGTARPGVAADQETIFRLASMSKAIGATAAAILADRGRLDWDAPVDSILPAFADLMLLDGYAGAHPVLRKPKARATLRHLATHLSGLGYEFYDPDAARYLAETGIPSMVSGQFAALRAPLLFEAGTRWRYGGGPDWLGLAVAAIDGRPIDRFCEEEIFAPLRMTRTRFERSETVDRHLGGVFARIPAGGLVPAPVDLDPPSSPDFYGMGNALYATAGDYLRFLRMWLGRGQLDGVRLIGTHNAVQFLANQIGTLRLPSLPSTVPAASAALDLLPGHEKSHSLGFARLEESIPGRRHAGSQFWGGVMNTHFWMDPARDLAGVFMTQLVPFLDPGLMASFTRFERAVYARYDSSCPPGE